MATKREYTEEKEISAYITRKLSVEKTIQIPKGWTLISSRLGDGKVIRCELERPLMDVLPSFSGEDLVDWGVSDGEAYISVSKQIGK